MPPQGSQVQPAIAPQEPVSNDPVHKHHWLAWTILVVLILALCGFAYAYEAGYAPSPDATTINAIVATSTDAAGTTMQAPSTTSSNTTTSSTGPTVMPLADYNVGYKAAAPDRMANTVRLQFYSPSQFSGYDAGTGDAVVSDAQLPPCGPKCTGNEQLRLDFIPQGASPDDPALASVSLAQVQQEYTAWVQNGRQGTFYSSIITVPLPTPPAMTDFAKTANYDDWIGVIYYDLNGNGKYDVESENELLYTDQFDYYWSSVTNPLYDNGNDPLFIQGWNFEPIQGQAENAAEAKYANDPQGMASFRKSFETTIMELPLFTPVQQNLIALNPQEMMQQIQSGQ